jgi:hypothetical protein
MLDARGAVEMDSGTVKYSFQREISWTYLLFTINVSSSHTKPLRRLPPYATAMRMIIAA